MAWCETYKPINFIFFKGEAFTAFAPCERFQIRGRSSRKDERTPDQVVSREFLRTAKKLWSTLSEADKAAWNKLRTDRFEPNKREILVKRRGIDAFVRASIVRQTAGLDPMPALPYSTWMPESPDGLDLLPGADARELAFRITHRVSAMDRHALLVRVTPTVTIASRTPYKTSLRHVRGVGQGSVVALPESGGIVRIPEIRFELEVGRMYAVEVRIVRLSDGGVSPPRYTAGVREEEPALSAGSNESELVEVRGEDEIPIVETATEQLTFDAMQSEAMAMDGAGAAEQGSSTVASTESPEAALDDAGEMLKESAVSAISDGSPDGDPVRAKRVKDIPPEQWEELGGFERNELIRKEELRQLASQHGCIHFPSYYVLNKYFNWTGKPRASTFGGPSIFELIARHRDILSG